MDTHQETVDLAGKQLETLNIKVQAVGNGRFPLWILLSVVIGFFLPICACGVLFAATLSSVGVAGIDGGSGQTSVGTGDAVAIVRVEGAITHGDGDSNGLNQATGAVSGIVINDLRAAADDPTVKAIVLRVDSPGGTVTGSAQIYEVIQEIEKPIVVSMGALAASGGYYVSAPTDYIFARADTWTGSIGVISQLINAEELINEIGVEVTLITSAKNKGLGNMFVDLTPEQAAIFQSLVDESFADFVEIVVNGRSLTHEEVLVIADGRIYSGRQALENGLVDELGNFEDAIGKAAELAGISSQPRIVEYEHIPSFNQILSGFSTRFLQSDTERVLQTLNDISTPSLEYRYVGSVAP